MRIQNNTFIIIKTVFFVLNRNAPHYTVLKVKWIRIINFYWYYTNSVIIIRTKIHSINDSTRGILCKKKKKKIFESIYIKFTKVSVTVLK